MQPSTLENTQTEAGIAAALALESVQSSTVIDNHGVPLLLTPESVQIQSLEKLRPTPLRAVAKVRLYTGRDLHHYLLKQTISTAAPGDVEGGPKHHPVLFCDRKAQSIVAYLDYHHASGPRWLNHTASIQFEASHQFKRWKDNNEKPMSQESFAIFLDEVLNDFITPTGAEVLSFAESLEATSTQVFKSAVKLATGETNIVFTDARAGDVSTRVIDGFTIGIPIWQNGEKVQIEARLFHRIVDVKDNAGAPTGAKSLKFWFKLRHLDEIIDTLFDEEMQFLRSALENVADVYMGLPPADPTTQNIN